MTTALAAYLLSAALLAAPHGKSWRRGDKKESKEDHLARYGMIAEREMAAAFDPATKPLPLMGPGRAKRVRSALFVHAVFWHESFFSYDVMRGEARGDDGRSWCPGQLHIGFGKTQEGWTGPQLVIDGKHPTSELSRIAFDRCTTATYNAVARSFHACRSLPEGQRLRAYASGTCNTPILKLEHGRLVDTGRFKGEKESADVYKLYTKLLGRLPAGLDDEAAQREAEVAEATSKL